jgi:hypothetical protein
MGLRKPKRSQRRFRRSNGWSDAPRHALSLARLDHLEDRRLLSFNVVSNTWTPIGPAPITNGETPGTGIVSGEVTGIATDPNNANVIYLATSGGGVWKSTNAGGTWAPLMDDQALTSDHLSEPNNAVFGSPAQPVPAFTGSIAVEHQIPAQPTSPLVVYVGTGEANNSIDSYYGRGVLSLVDDGAHAWQFSDANGAFEGETISKIVIDPTNPSVVYAAASNNGVQWINGPRGAPSFGNTGVWKSTDGGVTWNNTTANSLLAGGIQTDSFDPYSDLLIDPAHPNTLYTAIGNPNGAIVNVGGTSFDLNGIYKTTDGGVTWTQLNGTPGNALPKNTDTTVGRIALAISPSSPNTLYATFASTSGNLKEFVRSVDGGGSWTNLTSTPDFLTPAAGQTATGQINMAMAVDLGDQNTVYVAGAGENIIKTSDGGLTWNTIEVDVNANGPHANHHALVLDANNKLLDGNDGGIWRLDNPVVGALLWTDLNANLQVTQLNGVALHPTDPNTLYGGSQDNGTLKTTGAVVGNQIPWNEIQTGNSGYVRVDQVTPNVVYRENTGDDPGVKAGHTPFFQRSNDSGTTWTPETKGLNPNNSDPSNQYVPFIMDPSNSKRLLAGTDRIYETIDQGNDWNAISTPGTHGWATSLPTGSDPTVDAIAVSAQKSSTIYAAAGPDIFVTTNDGASWQVHDLIPASSITANSSPINFSTRFSALLTDPNDSTGQTCYAVIAGRDTDSTGQTHHIYQTTDGGVSWTDITGLVDPSGVNGLFDQPMNSLAFDASTKVLYLGTDTGVYASDTYNNGANTIWNQLAAGPNSLPNAQVTDLEINTNLGILAAATHGRGAWELEVHVLQGQTQTETEGFAFANVPVLSFNDPAGSKLPTDFKATIVWGDGATTSGPAGAGIAYNPATGLFTLSGSHTYTEEGVYLPTVSITNLNTNVKQTTNATINVVDPLAAGTGTTLAASEGVQFANQQVATFIDPAIVPPNAGITEPLTDYSATIFWGDNTSSTGNIVSTTSTGTFAVQGGHLYAEEGPSTITVIVAHDKAAPVTITSSANVSDLAVVATGSFTFAAVEGTLSPFEPVASFKDPAGLEAIGDYSATIDWGDGSTPTAGVLSINFSTNVVTVSGHHQYNQVNINPGFAITTTVNHDVAPSASATSTAIVAFPQLLGSGGLTMSATEGATSPSQPIATFTDPNPAGPQTADQYSATILWGDGSSSNSAVGDITLGPNSTFTVFGSHSYAEEGSYNNVQVVLKHQDAPPATVVSSATVADPPVIFGNPVTLNATEAAAVTNVTVATFTDPAGNPNQDETGGPTNTGPFDYTATINWGDGTTTTVGTVSFPDPSGLFTVSGSHTYAQESGLPYSVTVTVHHDTAPDATLVSAADVTDAGLKPTGGYTFLATEGTPSTVQPVASFQDLGGAESTGHYLANIDWGDGETSVGTITSIGGLFFVAGSHLYQEEPSAGSFSITTKIVHDPISTAPDEVTAIASSVALASDPQVVVTGNYAFKAVEGTPQAAPQTLLTFTDPGDPNGLEAPADYTATINWGDTQTTAGSITMAGGVYTVQARHAYAEEGFDNIQVTIHHGTAADSTATSSAQVTDAPLVVTGNLTFSTVEAATSTPNQIVATFTDSGGAELLTDYSAIVNWGDGSSSAGVVSGPDIDGVFSVSGTHSYGEEGTYTLGVTIHHDSAFDATLPANEPSVAVVNDPSVVPGSGTTFAAVEGIPTPVQAVATFVDPAGSETLSNYSATINWNDGTPLQAGQITWNALTTVFTVSAAHTYPDGGSPPIDVPYTVILHHDTSPDVTVSGIAAVSGQAIVATGGFSFSAKEGTTATNVTVATFTDPGFFAPNPLPTSDYFATIDWGDQSGTTAGTVALTNSAMGLFSVAGSHFYAQEGTYNVAVTIVHDGFTVGASSTADVSDVSLSATGGFTYTAAEGAPGSNQVLATFTDPAGPEPLANYSASVAWGDGSVTPGTVSFDPTTQSFSVTGSHSYTDELSSTGITVTIHHAAVTPDQTVTAAVSLADPQIIGNSVAVSVTASATNVLVATFFDPGGAEPAGNYSARVAWGDGSTTAGTITLNPTGSFFTVTANPPLGIDDVSSAVIVTITHAALPPIQVDSTVVVGEPPINVAVLGFRGHEFSPLTNVPVATFTHGEGAEPAGVFAASVDWGDGTTTAGVIVQAGPTYTVFGSHTYGDEGTYTAKVTATEQAEAVVGTASGTVMIATEILPIADPANPTPSEKYVAEVYSDVLGREVDPAGLAYWSSLIDQGVARSTVAANLLHTPEYFSLVITPAYEKYLGRAPDFQGLQFWITQMLNGLTDEELEAGFIGSPEFFARAGGTDLAWVDAMYLDLLGRPADASGEAFWVDQLLAGESRTSVALGFTTSPEREAQRIQEDYFKFLGRAASDSEVAGFVNAFEHGATNELLIAGFIGSDEYYNRVQAFPD